MSFKRYIPFILLNIVISAAIVLAVLYFWEQAQTEDRAEATATSVAATAPVATAAAVATASAPPTVVQPTKEPLRHIVSSGDTLGTIAELYDVPIQDIAQVNQITNPDILAIGTELVIPIGGVPTVTPAPSPSPTSAEPPTPIPTVPPALGEAEVIIADITGVGDPAQEAIVIANNGSRQIQLANWTLEDSQGNVYTFNPFFLFGNSANVMLYTGAGNDTTSALYWGLSFSVWETGETATLRDPDGTARASFTVP